MHRPVHEGTGIQYSQEYWSIEVTRDGEALVHANEHLHPASAARPIATLMIGDKYDLTSLVFTGWTAGDGSSAEGYCVEHYFDAKGRYLGPDQYGIEPTFE